MGCRGRGAVAINCPAEGNSEGGETVTAFNAAMRTGDEPGIRGILGGPGPDWEFSYTKGGR